MPTLVYEIVPCPVCGEESSETIADADEIREEVEALWAFHDARLRPDTPPESLVDRVAFSQHPPLQLVQCVQCGMVFRNPRERDFVLRDVYAGEEPDPAVLERLYETQRAAYRSQAERLTSVAGRPGRVLEVGSYVGGFLAAATDAGWQAEGVDVNESATAVARAKGLRVAAGELETFAGAGQLDAVAIWNCFDQLPAPRQSARRAHDLLRPGGVLVVRVPNGAFYARVRQQLRGPHGELARLLLAHNNLLSFPYRHGFTPGSLRRLLHGTGFTVAHTFGDALVPIADEWTQPWAAWEERVVKRALRELAEREAEDAPWLEVYARKAAVGRRPSAVGD
jgi:SAM-dependent methyltransferase